MPRRSGHVVISREGDELQGRVDLVGVNGRMDRADAEGPGKRSAGGAD